MIRFISKRFLLSFLGVIIFISLWEFITFLGVVKPIFLPSPLAVLNGIEELIEKGWLQRAALLSILRVLKALLLVILFGTIIGSAMGVSKVADGLLTGLISGGKSIPVTGFLGLIVLWFSINEKAKIAFLFLVSIFYMVLLVRDSIHNVKNSEYMDVARNLGANRIQIFKKILFPAAFPQIFNAVIVSNSLMWSYIVLVEYINGNEVETGLGYLIYISSRTQDSAQVFGLLIIIAGIASFFDFILRFIKRKYIKWN